MNNLGRHATLEGLGGMEKLRKQYYGFRFILGEDVYSFFQVAGEGYRVKHNGEIVAQGGYEETIGFFEALLL